MFVKDKSAFFKFSPEEEKEQGIGYLLFEMFKIQKTYGRILGFESDIDRLRKANSFETFAPPTFDKTENSAGEIL